MELSEERGLMSKHSFSNPLEVNLNCRLSEGGVTDHSKLLGRDKADQHPIAAITGLRTELDNLATYISAIEDLIEDLQDSLVCAVISYDEGLVGEPYKVTDDNDIVVDEGQFPIGDSITIGNLELNTQYTITLDNHDDFHKEFTTGEYYGKTSVAISYYRRTLRITGETGTAINVISPNGLSAVVVPVGATALSAVDYTATEKGMYVLSVSHGGAVVITENVTLTDESPSVIEVNSYIESIVTCINNELEGAGFVNVTYPDESNHQYSFTELPYYFYGTVPGDYTFAMFNSEGVPISERSVYIPQIPAEQQIFRSTLNFAFAGKQVTISGLDDSWTVGYRAADSQAGTDLGTPPKSVTIDTKGDYVAYAYKTGETTIEEAFSVQDEDPLNIYMELPQGFSYMAWFGGDVNENSVIDITDPDGEVWGGAYDATWQSWYQECTKPGAYRCKCDTNGAVYQLNFTLTDADNGGNGWYYFN